jgi:hypothetical protein
LSLAFGNQLFSKLQPHAASLALINRPAFVLVGLVESDPVRKTALQAKLKPIMAKLKASEVKGSQFLYQVLTDTTQSKTAKTAVSTEAHPPAAEQTVATKAPSAPAKPSMEVDEPVVTATSSKYTHVDTPRPARSKAIEIDESAKSVPVSIISEIKKLKKTPSQQSDTVSSQQSDTASSQQSDVASSQASSTKAAKTPKRQPPPQPATPQQPVTPQQAQKAFVSPPLSARLRSRGTKTPAK